MTLAAVGVRTTGAFAVDRYWTWKHVLTTGTVIMARSSATVKGPLSMGSEAADADYNQQMKDLMGQLVETPEQQRWNSLLAWAVWTYRSNWR